MIGPGLIYRLRGSVSKKIVSVERRWILYFILYGNMKKTSFYRPFFLNRCNLKNIPINSDITMLAFGFSEIHSDLLNYINLEQIPA